MASLRDAYEQRAQLTATGTAADKRVDDRGERGRLRHRNREWMTTSPKNCPVDEIAAAVTAAAQQAYTEMKRKTDELVAPMRERHAGMPKLPTLLPGVPDQLNSLSFPRSRRRRRRRLRSSVRSPTPGPGVVTAPDRRSPSPVGRGQAVIPDGVAAVHRHFRWRHAESGSVGSGSGRCHRTRKASTRRQLIR